MTRTQLRIGLAAAAIAAVVVLVFGVLAERSLRERERRGVTASLEERARLVREVAGDVPLQVPGRDALQAIAERTARSANARVTFVAADGTVVADSDVPREALAQVENHAGREEVAAALAGRTGVGSRLSRTVGRPYLYVAVPNPKGGAVRVAADLAFVDAEVATLRSLLLPAGAVAVAVAFALGIALAGRVIRPLHEIRDFLAGVARGDLDRRLPWHSPDELGEIASAIDQVALQLRSRIGELTAEKEQLRAVLLGMVEGVLVVDRDGRVVLANPRLRALFGVWGEVGGRSALEVIRRTEVEEALERAAASDEPVVAELRAGRDRERALEMHAVRFPASGPQLGTVAVFHDVTELRRLERVRREFVANVSHELKTPLTAIRGFAETLRTEGLSAEQRAQYLEVVLRHTGRLSALIDDLLELSRIEGRQATLDRIRVPLAPLVRGLLADLGPRLASRRLSVSVVCDDRRAALADRRALEQVLLNLLDNAIKYTDPGGRIQVRVAEEAERVRIDVSDDGIGIPEADRPRIFERFYRVDKARSRDLGGTGLGLSIVKHLVQALGGEVFVDSREGKGTTFSVLLPRADRAPGADGPQTPTASDSS